MTNNNSKNWLQILDVYANVLGTIGTLVIAGIGIWFTNSYNKSQQDLDRNQALTSVIEFIDESKPEAQLKTAYNILVKLGYQSDFIALAVDYPNPIATEKLIELAHQELIAFANEQSIDLANQDPIKLANQEGVEIPAYKAVDEIISNAEKSKTTPISSEKEKKLLASLDVIAQAGNYNGFEGIAKRAEKLRGSYLEKQSLKTGQEPTKQIQKEKQNLWVVVIAGYRKDQYESAKAEAVKAFGYFSFGDDADIRIYDRDDKYRVVSVYASQEDARKNLEKAKEKRSSSYLRNLEEWCSRGNCIEEIIISKDGSETKIKY